MLIGEIARQSGLSRDTIRYYEKLGLLRAAGRPSPHNTYKDYPPGTLTRLHLIQQGKSLGFTLAEIAEGLDLWENESLPPAALETRIQAKLTAIDAQLRQLTELRGSLLHSLEQLQAKHCL